MNVTKNYTREVLKNTQLHPLMSQAAGTLHCLLEADESGPDSATAHPYTRCRSLCAAGDAGSVCVYLCVGGDVCNYVCT